MTGVLMTYVAATPTGESDVSATGLGELTEVRRVGSTEAESLMTDMYAVARERLRR